MANNTKVCLLSRSLAILEAGDRSDLDSTDAVVVVEDCVVGDTFSACNCSDINKKAKMNKIMKYTKPIVKPEGIGNLLMET